MSIAEKQQLAGKLLLEKNETARNIRHIEVRLRDGGRTMAEIGRLLAGGSFNADQIRAYAKVEGSLMDCPKLIELANEYEALKIRIQSLQKDLTDLE
jgi:hypothetical protein